MFVVFAAGNRVLNTFTVECNRIEEESKVKMLLYFEFHAVRRSPGNAVVTFSSFLFYKINKYICYFCFSHIRHYSSWKKFNKNSQCQKWIIYCYRSKWRYRFKGKSQL